MRGEKNSITDVRSVRVGHLSFHRDIPDSSGQVIAARTGLTAVLPYPMEKEMRLFFASHSLRGRLEVTGFEVTEDFCYLNSPLVITNSFNLGKVYDTILSYGFALNRDEIWPPVVIGLNDSYLNGMDRECFEEDLILRTFREAVDGKLEEGSVGIGTGLRALGRKGGIGTSSRRVSIGDQGFTCGVLAASHFGNPRSPEKETAAGRKGEEEGALVAITALDVPLLPHQLQRVTRSLVARLDRLVPAGNFRDSILGLTFTTANAMGMSDQGPLEFRFQALADHHEGKITAAVFEAAEEAVLNSLLKARPVRGRSGRLLETIPESELAGIFEKKEA